MGGPARFARCDNVPKPILDALKGLVYLGDKQVIDVVCRRRNLHDDLLGVNVAPWLALRVDGVDPFLHVAIAPGRPSEAGPVTAADETLRRRNGDFSWVKKTADEYRHGATKFAFEQVGHFLPGFRADLVARKGDDKRVVEVKRRSSLQHDSIIDEVARTIESHPGWSLDIVIVPEPLHLVTPPESHPLAPQQASCGLDVSERLAELGQTAAAFLMAWSACEALLRGRVEGSNRDER